MRRIRSRAFIVGLVIGSLGILFITKSPQFMEQAFTGSKAVLLVGEPALTSRGKPLLADDFDVVATLAQTNVDAAVLKRFHAGSAIVLSQNGNRLVATVFAKDPASVPRSQLRSDLLPLQMRIASGKSDADVRQMMNIPVTIHGIGSKFTTTGQAEAAHSIAYTLIFFLYVLILINSQLVMSSVAEEKTTRIAELLIASVDAVALLAGKIAAAACLAILQMAIWIGIVIFSAGPSSAGGASQNPFDLSGLLTGDILSPLVLVAFVLFFVIGFFQLSTLFAGFASLINRTEDLGSVSGPLIIPVVGALFIALAALGSPDSPLVVVASEVPILSPFVMFARIAVTNVPLWQILLSLAINIAALVAIAIAAGRLYRVGMLLYGRMPKFSQILSVMRG